VRLNILEIFSEIVTGTTCVIFLIICCCLHGVITVSNILPYIEKYSSFTNLLGISLVVYSIGFLVDGIGLGLGDWFLDSWLSAYTADNSRRSRYIRNVSEHAFEYRNQQWAYYSSYRNLFLLLIPFSFCIVWTVYERGGWLWAIGAIFLFALLEIIIIKTMKLLLNLYYALEE
jgi:hypothetical protein